MSIQTTPMYTARELISRHVEWKLTLRYAIAEREQLSPEIVEQILHPDRCPIGRWLKFSCPIAIKASPEYVAVLRNHVDFHLQMTHISEMIAKGAFGAAERAISPGSAFMESAQKLAMSITALDRVERILAPV